MIDNTTVLTIGGGCFWCIETIFKQLKGVENVVSGYMGGTVPGSPTYREIASGLTGHAEVIQVTFNPDIISYKDLILIFMTSHDPTTLNRQGADVGTQYRSVIFYHNENQYEIADEVITIASEFYEDEIVTEVSKAKVFYPATPEHQNFYEKNKGNFYCSVVISPKLSKLKKMYADKLISV